MFTKNKGSGIEKILVHESGKKISTVLTEYIKNFVDDVKNKKIDIPKFAFNYMKAVYENTKKYDSKYFGKNVKRAITAKITDKIGITKDKGKKYGEKLDRYDVEIHQGICDYFSLYDYFTGIKASDAKSGANTPNAKALKSATAFMCKMIKKYNYKTTDLTCSKKAEEIIKATKELATLRPPSAESYTTNIVTFLWEVKDGRDKISEIENKLLEIIGLVNKEYEAVGAQIWGHDGVVNKLKNTCKSARIAKSQVEGLLNVVNSIPSEYINTNSDTVATFNKTVDDILKDGGQLISFTRDLEKYKATIEYGQYIGRNDDKSPAARVGFYNVKKDCKEFVSTVKSLLRKLKKGDFDTSQDFADALKGFQNNKKTISNEAKNSKVNAETFNKNRANIRDLAKDLINCSNELDKVKDALDMFSKKFPTHFVKLRGVVDKGSSLGGMVSRLNKNLQPFLQLLTSVLNVAASALAVAARVAAMGPAGAA